MPSFYETNSNLFARHTTSRVRTLADCSGTSDQATSDSGGAQRDARRRVATLFLSEQEMAGVRIRVET